MRTFAGIATMVFFLCVGCTPRAGSVTSSADPASLATAQANGTVSHTADSPDLLYEAAHAEGSVVFYSSLNRDDVKDLFPRFEAKYPGVRIEHVRASSETLLRRLLTEAKTGRVLADVFETNGFEVYGAIKAGLVEPFCPANVAELRAQLYDRECRWIGTRTSHDVVAWNTNLVVPDQAPRSYEDLADPQWNDRILMERSDVEMFNALLAESAYGEERGLELFRRIAANHPRLYDGHYEVADQLVAGEGAVLIGAYAHRIAQLQERGAPVDWMKTEGVLYLQSGATLRGAPHPNAGRLLLSWLVSMEGQNALSEVASRYPANPQALSVPFPVPSTMKTYPSRPEYAESRAARQRQWNELFGHG